MLPTQYSGNNALYIYWLLNKAHFSGSLLVSLIPVQTRAYKLNVEAVVQIIRTL